MFEALWMKRRCIVFTLSLFLTYHLPTWAQNPPVAISFASPMELLKSWEKGEISRSNYEENIKKLFVQEGKATEAEVDPNSRKLKALLWDPAQKKLFAVNVIKSNFFWGKGNRPVLEAWMNWPAEFPAPAKIHRPKTSTISSVKRNNQGVLTLELKKTHDHLYFLDQEKRKYALITYFEEASPFILLSRKCVSDQIKVEIEEGDSIPLMLGIICKKTRPGISEFEIYSTEKLVFDHDDKSMEISSEENLHRLKLHGKNIFGQWGRTQDVSVQLAHESGDQLSLTITGEKGRDLVPTSWGLFGLGGNLTFLQYYEDGMVAPYEQWDSGVNVSAQGPLRFKNYFYHFSGNSNFAVWDSSNHRHATRYLDLRANLGRAFPLYFFIKEVQLRAGWYYTSLFVEHMGHGFKNLHGPSLSTKLLTSVGKNWEFHAMAKYSFVFVNAQMLTRGLDHEYGYTLGTIFKVSTDKTLQLDYDHHYLEFRALSKNFFMKNRRLIASLNMLF